MTRPAVSSPLATSSQPTLPAEKRVLPKRNPSFPSSRALRPFPTISHIMQPALAAKASTTNAKTTKLIEPPKNYKATFVLDLTQAEFSRQDC
ncbi:hypothetical protein JR316_0001194 [Psilocybe cubensis]|uniref:Uncharacterized protein n=2 Tax=Psilocybe cubensis TaxID=181762 RepID=A0A8H7Y891_PSICU|nr:hypothetical protein JR316_0001194 [Psilocybe cubensis]KAH9487126.1 hypothetical protein JR316_0001194 [Psilocybe cubensis]